MLSAEAGSGITATRASMHPLFTAAAPQPRGHVVSAETRLKFVNKRLTELRAIMLEKSGSVVIRRSHLVRDVINIFDKVSPHKHTAPPTQTHTDTEEAKELCAL